MRGGGAGTGSAMSSEERIALAPYLVRKKCPRCEKGRMMVSSLDSNREEEFLHECDRCSFHQFYEKVYPHFTWEELELKLKN